MKPEVQRAIMERLRGPQPTPEEPSYALSTERYHDPAWHAREQAQVFARFPVIVAHASELAGPGDFLTTELAGRPLLLLRDREGGLRLFLNVCRHRGAPLVHEAKGSGKRSLTCRYHGWSWSLEGELRGLPMADQFPDLDRSCRGLIEVPFAVHHGFVWARLEGEGPPDIAAHLGPALEADLASFFAEPHRLYARTERLREANWKLVIDAFAEGYHARILHKETLARFFLDRAETDAFGLHSRTAGARRSFPKADAGDPLREHATLFYVVFPNAVFVIHPDFISQLSMWPEGPEGVRFLHRMMVPASSERDYGPSFRLIDEGVFEEEDLAIVEQVQPNMKVAPSLLVGGLERGVRLFHQALDRVMGEGG